MVPGIIRPESPPSTEEDEEQEEDETMAETPRLPSSDTDGAPMPSSPLATGGSTDAVTDNGVDDSNTGDPPQVMVEAESMEVDDDGEAVTVRKKSLVWWRTNPTSSF